MIRSPRTCLLDEPLASVDAELRLRMRGEIRAVQRTLGVPMVHVTHDQVEAMALGDRIAVMDRGRILQCDSPAEVHARPATTVVARTVGTLPMNLLPPVDGVVVGVRPERVRLVPADDTNGVTASVLAVEPAGEECLVRVVRERDPPSSWSGCRGRTRRVPPTACACGGGWRTSTGSTRRRGAAVRAR